MIRGLNHLTLATRDLARGVAFYRDTLGLTLAREWPQGAYFSAGDLWLCLSLDAGAGQPNSYSHAAFDVAEGDFEAMADKIRTSGARIWKENRSEGASLYFSDPDGNQLELHVGSLASRLGTLNKEPATC